MDYREEVERMERWANDVARTVHVALSPQGWREILPNHVATIWKLLDGTYDRVNAESVAQAVMRYSAQHTRGCRYWFTYNRKSQVLTLFLYPYFKETSGIIPSNLAGNQATSAPQLPGGFIRRFRRKLKDLL